MSDGAEARRMAAYRDANARWPLPVSDDVNKWADRLTVIRVSALNNYPDCNRRGAARMFRAEIEASGFKLRDLPSSVGAAVGTAGHAAAEVDMAEVVKTGKLPPVSVALDAARDSITEAIKLGVQFDGPHGTAHNPRDAGAQTASIVHCYHLEVAPQIHPVSVEQRFEAKVEGDLLLSGQPDIVCVEHGGSIRDLKTGARVPSSFAAQLGGYSLLTRSHGFEIEFAAIDFIKRVSPKKPQPPAVTKRAPIWQAETAATNLLKHIARDLDTFRNGDIGRGILAGDPWAFQPNPSSMLCSPKYCPAFGTEFCREGDPAKEE